MFEVMRTVEIKKVKPKSTPPKQKDDDKILSEAEIFAQTGAKKEEDQRCYACGKQGGYANDCKIRKEIVENYWYKNTGIEHYNTYAVSNNTQVAAVSTNHAGFVMMQVASKESFQNHSAVIEVF